MRPVGTWEKFRRVVLYDVLEPGFSMIRSRDSPANALEMPTLITVAPDEVRLRRPFLLGVELF